MAIDDNLCAVLSSAYASYQQYLEQAVIVTGKLLPTHSGFGDSLVAQFEIIHDDPICRLALADSCVHIVSRDDDIRFVAMEANYVSYWQRLASPGPGSAAWDLLSGGQSTDTNEICIIGQTLRSCISPQIGAGYLHYVQDARPGDGWTVNVGVAHPVGVDEFQFDVTVSTRPIGRRSRR